MEHILQIIVDLVFIYLAALVLEQATPDSRLIRWLVLFAPLVVMVRFEGVFPVGLVALLLLARRRWQLGVVVGVVGALPLVVYGLISVAHGWYVLPNSVLLKSTATGPASLGVGGFGQSVAGSSTGLGAYLQVLAAQLRDTPRELAVLLLVGAALLIAELWKHRQMWTRNVLLLELFVAMGILHLLFGRYGHWFLRYEAYLIALGIVVVTTVGSTYLRGLVLRDAKGREQLAFILSIAACILYVYFVTLPRSSLTLVTPGAMTNVYQQQYQMSRFMHTYYPGESVALNDIGTVDFFTDLHMVDLVGLANMDVARAKRAGVYDTAHIDAITTAHHVKIAILYDKWFTAPATWVKVGQWTIAHNVAAGQDTVSIYAVDPTAAATLKQQVDAFTPTMPR